jgi:hypothetical protein
MSITPNVPQSNESYTYEPAPTPRWIPLVIVFLVLAVGALVYLGYSSRTRLGNALSASNERAEMISKELDQTNSRVALLRGQLDVTSQKLGLTQAELAHARSLAQQIQEEERQSDTKLGEQLGQVQQVQKESDAKIGQVSTDLSGARTDIASNRKDLEDTRNALKSTIGDLGVQTGRIAHNEQEVDALKRLNERNIYDFKLTKSKNAQRIGPIQVVLRATDPKHYRFTMTVIADDKSIEKKDRTVNEPMQFYVRGTRAPFEIVVFDVAKNGATGYLSTPKEIASAAPAPPAPTASPAAAPARSQ